MLAWTIKCKEIERKCNELFVSLLKMCNFADENPIQPIDEADNEPLVVAQLRIQKIVRR